MTPLPGRHPIDAPAALLPYQQQLLGATDEVVVVEKSRRIGISWAAAAEAATVSSTARGADTLYIGYNMEMAREFIDDCAFWARHLAVFATATPEVEELLFEDQTPEGKRSIQAFRIAFAAGHKVLALSSKPRSLRGRQGFVVIDEAAFHDNLSALIKAAMALLIWGGRVWVISTHEGADNPFNELVEDTRAGRRPYRLFRFDFKTAVEQGLYRRIAMVTGKPWTADAEADWVAKVYAYYGDDAAEELDVVPSQGSGVWLSRALIDQCANPYFQVVYLACKPGFELEPDHVRRAHVQAWLEDVVDPLLAALPADATSFAGGDFGRSGDLTVLWPGVRTSRDAVLRVPFTIELRNTPFREQEQVMFHLLDRLPRLSGAAFDARGLGAGLAEVAMQRYGEQRVEQVKATRDWYRETAPGLKARFEDRTIEIPRDDDVRQDLRSVRVDKGVPMVPEDARYRSIRGGQRHGDAAIAAMMLQRASLMDAVAYGYTPARQRREAEESDDGAGYLRHHQGDGLTGLGRPLAGLGRRATARLGTW